MTTSMGRCWTPGRLRIFPPLFRIDNPPAKDVGSRLLKGYKGLILYQFSTVRNPNSYQSYFTVLPKATVISYRRSR